MVAENSNRVHAEAIGLGVLVLHIPPAIQPEVQAKGLIRLEPQIGIGRQMAEVKKIDLNQRELIACRPLGDELVFENDHLIDLCAANEPPPPSIVRAISELLAVARVHLTCRDQYGQRENQAHNTCRKPASFRFPSTYWRRHGQCPSAAIVFRGMERVAAEGHEYWLRRRP